jgi:enoyl-CoA hydratase/carnithine racemase
MADLLVEHDDGLSTITLNRAARRNALSLTLMRDLVAAIENAAANSRAIILAATGPVFCSGHDLAEMAKMTVAGYREVFDVCTLLMETIQRVPTPVIAAVQGLATAAGCQLAATCDLVVAAENAAFATPGVKIGLFCSTPMVALTRAIGRKRAMEMLLTGRVIPAQTAAEWGLVNRVVPAAQLLTAARELAREIAAASRFTVGLGKQAFYAQIELDQAKAYAYAKAVMTMNALAADAQEGIDSFLTRRQPCWTDS